MQHLSEEAKFYLKAMESLVSSGFHITLLHHSKAIRDIMDNLEGHLYGCLNSNNRYSHSILKYDAPHMSLAASKFRETVSTQNEFLKRTHRDHAKPFAILVKEIEGLKGKGLLDYVVSNVKSVTILKRENNMLNNQFKSTMPDTSNIFSRYQAVGIDIIERKRLL